MSWWISWNIFLHFNINAAIEESKERILETLLFFKLASIHVSNIVAKKVIDMIRESFFKRRFQSNYILRVVFYVWDCEEKSRLAICYIIFLNDVSILHFGAGVYSELWTLPPCCYCSQPKIKANPKKILMVHIIFSTKTSIFLDSTM